MNKSTIRKHHKWFGLAMGLCLLPFCLSGLLLNHRHMISNYNVSRTLLPARYAFHNWNGGLLRGTHRMADGNIVVYGSNGMFLTDSTATSFGDFNDGLPSGTDFRQIRGMATPCHSTDHGATLTATFAVSPFALYRYGIHGKWHTVNMPLPDNERLSDITSHGDTLVVLGRSHIYTSIPPYKTFRRIQPDAPKECDGKVTAFRTVWLLHSGELFGTTGVLVADAIAVGIIIICLTGLLFWMIKKVRPPKERMKLKAAILRHSLSWHDHTGRSTIILTLLICITGWCLRPPVMVALALIRIPTLPGTSLHSDNAWNDKLRMLRHDDTAGDWIVSTSEGFYSLGSDIMHPSAPQHIAGTPPVSVMGLNVWQKTDGKRWLCGSFSGMFVWDRAKGTATDYFTHKPAPHTAGPPFGKKAIAGYSKDFTSENGNEKTRRINVVAEYHNGTTIIRQPEWMNTLPMSLWNAALEVHSGRMFVGDIATYVFVFFAGLAAVWCLWTGYITRKR